MDLMRGMRAAIEGGTARTFADSMLESFQQGPD